MLIIVLKLLLENGLFYLLVCILFELLLRFYGFVLLCLFVLSQWIRVRLDQNLLPLFRLRITAALSQSASRANASRSGA